MDGDSPRRSPRKKSLAEIKAEARKKMNNKGGADPTVLVDDPDATALASKERVRGKTGLVWHDDMTLHKCPYDENYIEKPQRLTKIRERMEFYGLWDRCEHIESPLATDTDILALHSPEHLSNMKDIYGMDLESLKRQHVYVNEHSDNAIRRAVGGTQALTKAVLEGKLQNGIALVRPPGHHAGREEFSGFCLCNNVALAANYALVHGAKKVFILDFDVHHGQGTQDFFASDPRVFYFSSHRYQHGAFWPHLRRGDADYVGADVQGPKSKSKGKGFTGNLPLNDIGCTNADYMTIMFQILLPLLHEFQPDLILVSAGYDAAFGDPEGEMRLTPALYWQVTTMLMSFASGKVVAVLEGGYFLDSLAESAAFTLRALLGDHAISLGKPDAVKDCVDQAVLNFKSFHRPYWKNFGVNPSYEGKADEGEKLHHKPKIEYVGSILAKEAAKIADEYNRDDHYLFHTPEIESALVGEFAPLRSLYEHKVLRRTGLGQKRVALVYDEDMTKHRNVVPGSGRGPEGEGCIEEDHPEKPERIQRIFQTHVDFGLVDRWRDVLLVKSRHVTQEEVTMVHDEEHWIKITEELGKMSQHELTDYAETLDSIYLNPDSAECAKLAAGSLLAVVDAVMNEEAEAGVAIIRPPGHHAEPEEANGFCVFNNVSIAAKYALEVHGLDRVMILDWGVHHGNGIQHMFYESDKVLYVSLHRFDHGTFFPTRPDAGADFVGSGRGAGFNVNIPWNVPGVGDTEYALAFYNIVLPIAYAFDPQLVLVSAGFDAARGDPLGHCKVSPEMYFHMTHLLTGLAEGNVVVALEGGYNLNSISLSMTMCTKALLKDPAPPLARPYKPPKPSCLESIRETARHLRPYWPCLDNLCYSLPESLDGGNVSVNDDSPVSEQTGGEGAEIESTTPYIPMEIIRFESITGISTLSVNKTSGKAFLKQIESTVYEKAKQQYKVSVTTQDSKTEHNVSNGHSDTEAKEQESKSAETSTNQSNSGTTAEDAERSVVDQLSNLFIRSSPPSAPTQVPPPVTDYMPNQFGSYSGSSYTSSSASYSSSAGGKAVTQSTESSSSQPKSSGSAGVNNH